MTINKILVVDDSPTDLSKIRDTIGQLGYTVVTAASGEDALTRATKDKPDLIFLDIVMPGMDGFKACRELAQHSATKGIPVVFVSSKNQQVDRLWAQMQGGKGYLTKPYSDAQIMDQIKAFA